MNRIIGVLWSKQKDDLPYYSGVIQDFHGDINIAVFPNTYKEKDNQPDWNIVISFPPKNGKSDIKDDMKAVETARGKKRQKKPDNNDETPF